ncbi:MULTISPECIES: alanine--glyoxylate aminotransferase family protein [unclassified Paenibacillus]|uniref:pyridoxal-phosphate-dependent aminotransferase family protein n=1 Tax=unclassified Paenibacillus TaxID=185978 RepID=UPI0009572B80|nr:MULTISPECIES: alanine--glyoxylate aminotransferase family protein [unclassified Paenibacillus]ASS66826.1 alanine--glyoxylate aminotransferase family protein [Paenibacillus sp. RUD330]SIP94262.1 (S)-ureidoglycine-glyoxylate aminotransferase [Paenibacillus sp. RU4X]SIQ12707.1 (S)-ureidoglycine-glyoxylate aminotransferase [Paenibacillus sp. RU4T]
MKRYADLSPSPRIIMTPGPVEVDPRVLRAMSHGILGQFDPEFTGLMNETMEMLRELFRTTNRWAYPVDGTSRSGIEAVLAALIEPGDRVLVPIFGRFGYLLQEIAQRLGAEVYTIEKEWGTVFESDEVIAAIEECRPQVVLIVHGETSTGRVQPLAEIGRACRERDILIAVDAVATLGGVPVETDAWCLDAVVGGTQKCLSVPSGLAPVTYNDRAERKLLARKRVERGLQAPASCAPSSSAASAPSASAASAPSASYATARRALPLPPAEAEGGRSVIPSNYLDLSQLQDYWSPARLNHHTEMTSMLYALREGLRLVLEEGLEARFARHRLHEGALMAGLGAMGHRFYGDPACKLAVVACIEIPDGIDGESVRSMLLEQFGIEIASSFGPLKGRIWRIGTMGYSSSKRNVLLLLGALEAALLRHGADLPAGAAVQAALRAYEEAAS